MKNHYPKSAPTKTDITGLSSLRPLIIIEILAISNIPLSQNELLHHSNIPRSSLIRYLDLLEEKGFIIRLPKEHKYSLAPRTIRLGIATLQSNQFISKARKVLKKLAQELQESCNLTVLNNDSVRYLAREEYNQPWSLNFHVKADTPIPLHCSASGKLFLSYMSYSEQNACLQRLELDSYTRNSITDVSILKKELEKIKRQGFSIDNSELVNGMIAVAVPIFDTDNENALLATVACHAVTIRTDLSKLLSYKEQMHQAAQEISILFSNSSEIANNI